MSGKINLFGKTMNVYKAALHMHSTVSDGQFDPLTVMRMYEEAGYDVYAFTDHRKTNPVSSYRSEMTLISGMEIHPAGPRGIPWHIVALNVPESFENPSNLPAQDAVDRVVAAGGLCIVAHPYWCGFTSAEVMTLKSVSAMEVYNSECRYIGRGYNMQLWDEVLDAGSLLPPVAVDDLHGAESFSLGWTMIAAKDCSVSSLMNALREGSMYASQGPEIFSMTLENKIFRAEFSPCTEAIVMSNRSRGFCGMVEPRSSERKKECNAVEFDLSKVAPENYLRLQIMDRDRRYAWSAPFRVSGK